MTMPPVTWQEVRNHLVGRLALDAEWTLHGDDVLIWQPGLLPVRVAVYEEGTYSDGFPWLAVKATTVVAELPEEQGLALAEAGNLDCTMATFFYDGSVVVGSVGVTLNADGRTNLVLLHNAILLMSITAHRLAAQTQDQGHRLPPLTGPAEQLGRRRRPDELLGILDPGALPAHAIADVPDVWREARPMVGRHLAAMGFEPGHSNHEVDFYSAGGFDVGFGLDRGPGPGRGLRIMASASPLMPPNPPYPAFVNDTNSLLGARVLCNIGNLRWLDPGQGWGSLQLHAFLPGFVLAEYRTSPQTMFALVVNSVMQAFQGARAVGTWLVEGSDEA